MDTSFLLNYDWLSAQLSATNLQMVIAEYNQFLDDETVQLVCQALHLSASILERYPDQLAPQLTGRLWEHRHKAGIADLYASALAKSAWKWGDNLPNSPLESAGSRLIHQMAHQVGVGYIIHSPDKTEIATGDLDGHIRVWDAKTGELRRQWRTKKGVSALAWDGCGGWLASGEDSKQAFIWDAKTGEQLCQMNGDFYGLWDVALDKEGGRILIARNNFADVWDVVTGERVAYMESGYTLMKVLCWNPDYTQIAVGASNYLVYIWNMTTYKIDHVFRLNTLPKATKYAGTAQSLAWDKTGRYVAVGMSSDEITIWDAQTGELRQTLRGHFEQVVGVIFDTTGNWLASASTNNTIHIWDVNNGAIVNTFGGFGFGKIFLDWDEHGLHLNTNAYQMARIWTIANPLVDKYPIAHSESIYALAWDNSGGQVAVCGRDRRVTFWDVMTGKVRHTSKKCDESVDKLVFDKTGAWFITLSGQKIMIWDAQKCKVVTTIKIKNTPLQKKEVRPILKNDKPLAVVWDETGTRFATGSADSIARVWDGTTGEVIHPLVGHDSQIYAIDWHEDCIITGALDKTIRVWNAQTGENTHILECESKIYCLSFDETGRYFASGGDNYHLWLWDAKTAQRIRQFDLSDGFDTWIGCLSWHPNGKYVATGSNCVRVWEIHTGACVARVMLDGGSIKVAWSPDGAQLAVGDGAGRLLWMNWLG